jgi:hypothetical protein
MHHMSVVPPNDHSKPSVLSVSSVLFRRKNGLKSWTTLQKKERTKVLDYVDGTYEEKERGRSLPP